MEEEEERPSTRLGTSEEGDPPSREASADEGGECIRPSKNRRMQVAKVGRRKLFGRKRKEVFLEWFAATANLGMSAEQAGVNYKTVLKHRMNDEAFREEYDLALDQGVARAKAKLIETKAREPRIGIEGDLDAPEMEDPDPQIVLAMLREHERRLAGYPKRGAAPRVATNAEVRAALTKALKAYRQRAEARRAMAEPAPAVIASEARQSSGDAETGLLRRHAPRNDELEAAPSGSQDPLHQLSAGPPPRAGEDL